MPWMGLVGAEHDLKTPRSPRARRDSPERARASMPQGMRLALFGDLLSKEA